MGELADETARPARGVDAIDAPEARARGVELSKSGPVPAAIPPPRAGVELEQRPPRARGVEAPRGVDPASGVRPRALAPRAQGVRSSGILDRHAGEPGAA
mmetsp:Transcript_30835/g.57636  ORF Transcript_30835/g.57636 Transcript_30835/m.57636 type:complete len:100 (-) Transcript_30835:1224-1523(-)